MAQPNRHQRRKQRIPRSSAAGKPLEIRYAKSNSCRVIHADGAWGGVTPQLAIYMALYSEHNTPPERAELILDRKNKTAEQRYAAPANPWVREIEAEVIMSREVARSLRDWLTGRLDAADKMESDADATFAISGGTEEQQNADSN